MSRGRFIFLIFHLFFSATSFVFVSISSAIFSEQKFFTFTNPIAFFGVDFSFGASFVVWSKLSWPFIMLKISLVSSGEFVSGPMQSKDIVMSISPYRETAPYVGFSPTTPQFDAGTRIEPPVSEPSEKSQSSAAIAAAEPELEPPGTSSGFLGFFVGPKAEVSPDHPHANSSMFNIPNRIASSARSLLTTVALYPDV